MFDIEAKRTYLDGNDKWRIALKPAGFASEPLAVKAATKTDAVVAMRARIDEWIDGLKDAKEELEQL